MVTDTDRERARQFCRRFMRLSNSLAEDEFVAALAEARRGAGWQPIETAPKDRIILLFYPECQFTPILTGKWLVYYETGGDEIIREQRCWSPELNEELGESVQPSHWMPLPEPPRRPRSTRRRG